jgi:hydroxyacylglutathione hydrolase
MTETRTLARQHGFLSVRQFPCLQDNYAFLLRDEGTGEVACVDTPDADAISAEADRLGWRIGLILNTHWHPDHTGGNEALKARYGARVIGPAAEGDRIPGRDQAVSEGDTVRVGGLTARVIDTGGHTKGHVTFHFEAEQAAFVGDTLFSLGCGRLFEGTAGQMWRSLSKLRGLPDDTTIYCAHEYTGANARFALSVDPENEALQARAAEVARLREAGEPSVPVRLGDEKQTNPFLRADEASLAARMGIPGAPPHEVFGEVRARKDAA